MQHETVLEGIGLRRNSDAFDLKSQLKEDEESVVEEALPARHGQPRMHSYCRVFQLLFALSMKMKKIISAM
jgi:hypothetical protein